MLENLSMVVLIAAPLILEVLDVPAVFDLAALETLLYDASEV
jgi:hypothetical protein